MWTHRAPILDQFFTNGCTGFALSNCLNTTYFGTSRRHHRYLTHEDALDLYSKATELDEFPGSYPPNDTGSSSIGACKAGVRFGYLSGYRHTFGFTYFCSALQLSPMIVGTNWYSDMTYPDKRGFVYPTGDVVGGHEYTAVGVNYQTKTLHFVNSWGKDWGRNGRFKMRFDDFESLLAADGDATVPIGAVHA